MLMLNSFSLGLAAHGYICYLSDSQTEVIIAGAILAFTDYSVVVACQGADTPYEVDKMLVECEIQIEVLWKRPRPRHRTFFLHPGAFTRNQVPGLTLNFSLS